MMPPTSKAERALIAVLPSSIRRASQRRRLKRRHHLARLGPDFDFWVHENTVFEPSCALGGPVYIADSRLGAYTYVEIGSRISRADIGRFCSIAPYSLIGMAEHPARGFVSTHPAFYRHAPRNGWDIVDKDQHEELRRTYVGNDVWVGAGATVRGGITIGDGAIIGAGAVVTRDVEPYEIVGGVPAATIRFRFDEATRHALLRSRWWDRDLEWIRQHASDFRDIDHFVARHADGRAVPTETQSTGR